MAADSDLLLQMYKLVFISRRFIVVIKLLWSMSPEVNYALGILPFQPTPINSALTLSLQIEWEILKKKLFGAKNSRNKETLC
jgi:hypothetical protein